MRRRERCRAMFEKAKAERALYSKERALVTAETIRDRGEAYMRELGQAAWEMSLDEAQWLGEFRTNAEIDAGVPR